MENKRKFYKNIIMAILSVLFFISSVAFIIGPSLMSYALGLNQRRYKRYEFYINNSLTAIAIGEFSFFIISALIVRSMVDFYNPATFWVIAIVIFLLNYGLSVFFYSLGARNKKNI